MVFLIAAAITYGITQSLFATLFLMVLEFPPLMLVWCIVEYFKALFRTHY